MSKQEEPLNEMSLNTLPGKPNALLSQKKALPYKDNCTTVHNVENSLERLSELLKDKNSIAKHKTEISNYLSALYEEVKSTHTLGLLNRISKQHLVFVVNLFNNQDALDAGLETLHLYNETNSSPVKDLHEMLLADYTFCNNGYLFTLKILAMQAILKLKSYDEYERSLLQAFAHDERYLLKGSNFKIHTLIKLVLHFYSVLPNSRVLFGLKFLQYVECYNLEAGHYIKNMGIDMFEQQLLRYVPERAPVNYRMYLRCFYMQYSKSKPTPEKLMYAELLKSEDGPLKDENDLFNLVTTKDDEKLWGKFLSTGIQDLVVIATRTLQNEDLHYVLKSLIFINQILRNAKYEENRAKASLLDKGLLFVNSHLKKFEKYRRELLTLLQGFYDYCMENNEINRLTNVINTFYNCFVVLRDFEFLKYAAHLEVSRYYVSKDDKLVRPMLRKFEKFVSISSTFQQKLEVFIYIFNVHITMGDLSFSSLQQFCQDIFKSVFSKLKLRVYEEFKQCSEVMLAFLYSNIPSLPPKSKSWYPATRMLYSSLSGMFDLSAIEVNSDVSRWHMLYKYEVLIKTAYYFNLEMSRHSTLNLASITKRYIDKWVKRSLPLDEPLSPFEIEMIKMLLEYLKFNNFDKLIIDLINILKDKERYDCIKVEGEIYLCNALINLKMIEDIERTKHRVLGNACDLKVAKLEPLMTNLRAKMQIFVWEQDIANFEDLFIKYLPLVRSELFDVDNTNQMPVSKYVKVLLFNIELLESASKLHCWNNCIVNSVIEGKKALKLSVCLLKKISKLSQNSRLRLIRLLMVAYINLIETYIRLGISKDCEFYAKEFSKVICELGEPTVVFDCLHFLYEYYQLTGQRALAKTVLQKSNKTFDFIDGETNIWGLTLFLHDNGEYEKLNESLRIFFNADLSKTYLSNYWRLKRGYELKDSECLCKYKTQNDINKLNLMYQRIVNHLESDPFLKSIFESITAVPSCRPRQMSASCHLQTPYKFHLTANVNSSPRSSNMTPRKKHYKQKFDREAAISNLENLIKSAEEMKLTSLKNYEISQLAASYSLALFLLSSISPERINGIKVAEKMVLCDIPRSVPLYHDKILNNINSEIYGNFKLLPMDQSLDPIAIERKKLLNIQETFSKCMSSFNVITIDICPSNDSLLLSKIDSKFGKNVQLRMPLNRAYARDLDCHKLTFGEAKEELESIIQENNRSTSIEVTSAIKTKEERKAWWETRYRLDRRLESLLSSIEHYWFSSLKGLFSPITTKPDVLKIFTLKFYEILHQNLPSRKQCGNPSMFTQIDSWIIELLLQLNPQDDQFALMMEDLLYFILDILLFQGEENAYDEIDFGGLHFHLEDQIRKFREQYCEEEKVVHTFLVVGTGCHAIPWESLSFMKSISVSRIPSYSSLSDLLTRFDYNLFPEISLRNKISMILNPQGDLNRTESRFLAQFTNIMQSKMGSKLLVNRKPDEIGFLEMLKSSNVFIYMGHGGGEQFVRLKEIKKCDRIAPSFLLGCSSGSMKIFPNLEPTGTVYSYLIGGCPLVLGNLWDVTDKDIDKFSESIFNKIGLYRWGNEMGQEPSSIGEKINICSAVSSSRDVCHLKYLNGAAPVVYGLPMTFINA
ncbi:ZYBA0S03-03950g1_1 [Zygosaccharomyces bailii CLIB 213]|uniref:separase n=1 Tax=Zygosaccharomyces bailii (strain CLIB 213 / ATCC 58445 / CBS 680 / BCRC 21525 / NBRC 1098 / NCYC 1416 / NRRL Y-2227) TaxID=1333698 RepID=A0A8J2T7Y1_ZYGB2|nr:ZYBA0S03-03950g1_1 [Zygosaccharomyces bailii CLIB 213]